MNPFAIDMTDAQGERVLGRLVIIALDADTPIADFTESELFNGSLYSNQATATVKGTIADQGWGYQLRITNSIAAEFVQNNNPDAEINRQDFDVTVDLVNGQPILIQAADFLGNKVTASVPVVVDTAGTEAGISGVTHDSIITASQILEMWGKDPNLARLRVSVDRTVVHDGLARPGEIEELLYLDTPPVPVASQDRLAAQVNTGSLDLGSHTLVVEAVDLAGNVTTTDLRFTIVEPPSLDPVPAPSPEPTPASATGAGRDTETRSPPGTQETGPAEDGNGELTHRRVRCGRNEMRHT